MASIKISNLASLNDVALNDVVAIVDDSATTTFKVTQEKPNPSQCSALFST